MKKAFIVPLLLLSLAAFASITLTNPYVVTQGSTLENDAAGAAQGMLVDWAANTVQINYGFGNVAAGALSEGTHAKRVIVVIDLTTGKWSSADGSQSGQLGAGALTSIQNTVKGWRNNAENFAINNSIIAGSQVAW